MLWRKSLQLGEIKRGYKVNGTGHEILYFESFTIFIYISVSNYLHFCFFNLCSSSTTDFTYRRCQWHWCKRTETYKTVVTGVIATGKEPEVFDHRRSFFSSEKVVEVRQWRISWVIKISWHCSFKQEQKIQENRLRGKRTKLFFFRTVFFMCALRITNLHQAITNWKKLSGRCM
jgi:hypothetical protein